MKLEKLTKYTVWVYEEGGKYYPMLCNEFDEPDPDKAFMCGFFTTDEDAEIVYFKKKDGYFKYKQ